MPDTRLGTGIVIFCTAFMMEGRVAAASPPPLGAERSVGGGINLPSQVIPVDFDGDGDMDVIVSSRLDDSITWFRSGGGAKPVFTKITLTAQALNPFAVAVGDIDGDGDLDVAAACFDDNRVIWIESVSFSGNGTFALRTIASNQLGVSNLTLADVDRDGDTDVGVVCQNEDAVRYHANDGTPGNGGWISRTISNALDLPTGLAFVDTDRDGDLDAVAISGTTGILQAYFNPGNTTQNWAPLGGLSGLGNARSIMVANIDNDGRPDLLTVSPASGWVDQFRSNGNTSWVPDRVISNLTAAGSVDAGDVDLDGDIDLLVTDAGDTRMYLLLNRDSGGADLYDAFVVSQQAANSNSARLADMDGDGDLDVVFVEPLVDLVRWQPIELMHRSAAFNRNLVQDLSLGSGTFTGLALGDFDDDGENDVVHSDIGNGIVRAHLHRTGAWSSHAVSSGLIQPRGNAAGDLDRDGKVDIITAETGRNRILLHRNSGTPGSGGWTTSVAVTSFPFASEVQTGDLDGDGDLDLVATANNGQRLAWYVNSGQPFSGAWTERVLESSPHIKVECIDIDRDGDIDIVAMSKFILTVLENNGAASPTFTRRILVNSTLEIDDFEIADINGDGRLDIAYAQADSTTQSYMEATASIASWTPRPFASGNLEPLDLRAFDADLDGDIDITLFGVGVKDFLLTSDGANPPSFTSTPISVGDTSEYRILDIEGDGDPDLLTIEQGIDALRVLKNTGGNFQLSTTSVAPAAINEGGAAQVFRIVMKHNGRTGEPTQRPRELAFSIKDSTGQPLSGIEFNSLVERVEIYAGAGLQHDPNTDTLLASGFLYSSTSGLLLVSLPTGDRGDGASVNAPATYFLVLSVLPGAGAVAPEFQVEHITDLSTTTAAAEAVFSDGVIRDTTLERVKNTISGLLVASCPTDFDQTGFVDTDDFTAFITAFENGHPWADFDGSGFVDTDDFTAFVLTFETGC
ncbi:MAG TPA: VCBS repeat-containing protein [Phycisphaerales bacterium]|nr:VCBS repeat-containing protein [Phycisphaerales bacterium]